MDNTIIHEISLSGYKATSDGMLDLGTWGSYGVEKLHCTLDEAWRELTITAFFNVKGEVVGKALVGKDGYADVPWEATKENTFAGRIVFEGSMDGQRRITTDLNFKVTNHSSIADVDSVPTDDRWNQFVTQNKEYRDGAYEAATKAEARAEDAAAASEDAQAAMRAAKASEDAAAGSKNAAKGSEDKAKASADAAAESETNASASERAAAGSAAAAKVSENAAAKSATDAEGYKNTASTAAQNATAAANSSYKNATSAADSAREAAGYAKTASDAAAVAADAKAVAVAAQKDAAASKTAAANSAAAAKASESAAAKSEENAKQSADTLAGTVENVAANTAAVAELREKKAEIDDTAVGADAWSSKHIIDMLCPKIEESGNPVQCYPVAGYPLGVTASWEPVQEGEGDPYPAGGGKNLFNPAWMPEKMVSAGVTWTITPDGTVTANGTTDKTAYYDSNNFSLPAGTYTISAMPMFRITVLDKTAEDNQIAVQSVGKSLTFTVENDIQKAALFFATTGTLNNVSAKPQMEKGTIATDYAPYENIRPIKGRDSVTVERCGGNCFDFSRISRIDEYTVDYEKKTIAVPAYTNNAGYVDTLSDLCPGISPGSWIISAECSNPTAQKLIYILKTRKAIKYGEPYTLTSDDISSTFAWYNGEDQTVQNVISDIQVTYGSTPPTAYSPYTGQSNTLTLPETIYGGSVDAVSGEGKREWKLLTLTGTEMWDSESTIVIKKYGFVLRTKDIQTPTTPRQKGQIVCNKYATLSANDTYVTNTGISVEADYHEYFRIYDEEYADKDIDAWKAYLAAQYAAGTPVQVCYKLATPETIKATGGAALPALDGANTVITDADSVEVTGRADPIKRIADLEAAVASIE